MKNFWILICLVFMGQTAMSQQIFNARDGDVQVWGKHMGASVVAESHKLKMNLNYETAEVEFRVAMESFTGNCDSFNTLARTSPGLELVFKGKMDLPMVSTQDHPLQTFKIEGLLNLDGVERPLSLNATIRHLYSGTVACQFSADFFILLSDFNPALLQLGFDNRVQVKLNETLIKRVYE